ncbi:MAG: alpha/beta fold hydrolase [Aureibaculum sp.]
MVNLKTIEIKNFITESGKAMPITLSYQTFGQSLFDAPVVLINHALTGNSNVCGADGWWQHLIGENKCINTNHYAVLAFNIPGNGFYADDADQFNNYKDFIARDIAKIFALGLEQLNINELFAVIGGSVGGGLAWELAALHPKLIKHLIPIASDWKSTDWLIANCLLQDRILNNSSNPVEDARIQAMLCYRTPASFKLKFDRSINEDLEIFNIESWLLHHGVKLKNRFQLSAYKLINQLLKTIDITQGENNFEQVVEPIRSHIHMVGIDSDLFFTPAENRDTFHKLTKLKLKASYYEIQSVHGHDAFLIEFQQLEQLLKPIFKNHTIKVA